MNQTMEGEFTNYCKQYYQLLVLLDKQETRFNNLLANAFTYTGQTDVGELDAIISCNRKIQKVRKQADDTIAARQKTAKIILQILAYFEIPPNTRLTCEIPGEMEVEVWADDESTVHCLKTKTLDPLEDDPNIITIHLTDSDFVWRDEED
jgi:hypothetical protein